MRLLLPLALALLLAGATTASAQDAAPTPCNGLVQVTDPNDVAAADKDVLGVFFRFDAGEATANVVLESAAPTLSGANTEAYWRVLYTTGGTGRWVGLRISRALPVASSTTTYEYGTFTGDPEDGGSYATDGTTEGRLFGDANGVLQIDIPAAAGGAAEVVLGDPYAVTSESTPLSGGQVDRAPDTGAGSGYTVEACTPLAPDTDGDGVLDSTDNCKAEANAGQEDFDGDKTGDACDPDDDNDGLSDAAETSGGLDPRKQDTDGDGVRDDQDVCPHNAGATANGCPTSSGNQPPQQGGPSTAAGTVIITSGSKRIRRGENYFVEGRVEPPRASVPLEIAGVDGKGKVVALATALTSADGTFSTSLEVPTTMAVLARVEQTYSKPVLVFLVPSVSLSAKVKRRFATTFTGSFSGRTTPRLNGRVTIQRRSGRRWVTVRTARVRRGRFATTKAGLKAGRYRAKVVETGVPNVNAYSSARRLK